LTDIHAPWRRLRREAQKKGLGIPQYPRFTEKRGTRIRYYVPVSGRGDSAAWIPVAKELGYAILWDGDDVVLEVEA